MLIIFPFSSILLLLLYLYSHTSLNSSKIKKVSDSDPIKGWLEKTTTATLNLKKKRKEKKKIGSGEDRSCGRSHAKRRLNTCATATISYFKFSQPVFRKKSEKLKHVHKPHIKIINESIMLMNQYQRPAGNLYAPVICSPGPYGAGE